MALVYVRRLNQNIFTRFTSGFAFSSLANQRNTLREPKPNLRYIFETIQSLERLLRTWLVNVEPSNPGFLNRCTPDSGLHNPLLEGAGLCVAGCLVASLASPFLDASSSLLLPRSRSSKCLQTLSNGLEAWMPLPCLGSLPLKQMFNSLLAQWSGPYGTGVEVNWPLEKFKNEQPIVFHFWRNYNHEVINSTTPTETSVGLKSLKYIRICTCSLVTTAIPYSLVGVGWSCKVRKHLL